MLKKLFTIFGVIGVFALLCPGVNLNARAAAPGQEGEPPEEVPLEHFSYDVRETLPRLDSPASGEEGVDIQGSINATPASWEMLAFQSLRDLNSWDIYLWKGNSAEPTKLTWQADADIHPRLNRGCSRFIFASDRDGDYEIFIRNVDGSGLTQLTWNDADDVYPVWSYDGTRIAFQSHRDGQAEVYVMNADGSGQTRLTWHPSYDGMPSWSPDDDRIAFISYRTGGYRVWVMDSDGGNSARLSNQAYSAYPVWSPDGSKIAYAADGDSDGFLDVWWMNADGGYQHVVHDPGYEREAWPNSWSPDGEKIGLTMLDLIYYEGEWYWEYAWLKYIFLPGSGGDRFATRSDLDWNLDWVTCDNSPPVTDVDVLPAQSPAEFTVTWTASDNWSGVRYIEAQVRDGLYGEWIVLYDEKWWSEGQVTYTGVGGHTYYFRVRARDRAGNWEEWPADHSVWTMVEAQPPWSRIRALPAYTRGPVAVQWEGQDIGGSGIQGYDVQYRDATAGENWVDWQEGTMDLSAVFSGEAGHTYFFRSRAVDKALNKESWPVGDGDAQTSFYEWRLAGIVRDNTGTPSIGATPIIVMGGVGTIPSDMEGNYAAYAANRNSYQVSWLKEEYGELPSTLFDAGQDCIFDAYLPPVDNLVQNWGFESELMETGSWWVQGVVTPSVTTSTYHTGDFAAVVGTAEGFSPVVGLYTSLGWSVISGVDLDENGGVHLLMSRDNYVYYKYRPRNGYWYPNHVLTGDKSYNSPDIAVQADGTVHVVWPETSSVKYVYKIDDSDWSEPQVISGDYAPISSPMIASDHVGSVHVLWQCDLAGSRQVCYAKRSSEGAWYGPNVLPGSEGMYFNLFRMVVDDNAVVHVLMVTMGDDKDLYYARRAVNGSWSPLVLISDKSRVIAADLKIDSQGLAHVVWGENRKLSYRKQESDDSWSLAQEFATDGVGPRLFLGSDGGVHVLFVGFGGRKGAYHAHRALDGRWVETTITSNWVGGFQAEQNKQGQLYILMDYQGFLRYAYLTQEGSWSPLLSITQTEDQVYQTRLMIDEQDSLHILWKEDDTIFYTTSETADETGISCLSQVITIPVTMDNPTLSFLYQLWGASEARSTGFKVRISDAFSTTTLLSTTKDLYNWKHAWFDLSSWLSSTITLTLTVNQEKGYPNTRAYIDEVTIGPAHPDLWVDVTGAEAALPGEQVVYQLVYGNRGGARAEGVLITQTLPAGIDFVSASVIPVVDGDTLLWDVGDLAGKSGPFTLEVTAIVATNAPRGAYLVGSAEISTASPELEILNNAIQVVTFVGQRVYLPVASR